ncbi:arginine repressor [Sporanaerobium hydrogeniformans]|uniref:Arginine repressor n=1 Tax=Sporanaerobium hydrogeniformans TaxID=3072179 RepID=A0AC61DJ47_9FIRM|nr:arginine repressor [Sporanaerobium hydrogeniformans]
MKEQRQSAILSLIQKHEIETQEDLATSLENQGFRVTQATVSRDIRELKLTKVASKSGGQKYVALTNYEQQVSEKVIRVFKDAFVGMECAGNILVIRTLIGMGNAVAAAIDAFNFEEIVGTLAGDDTIFCVIKTVDEMNTIMNKFKEILGS